MKIPLLKKIGVCLARLNCEHNFVYFGHEELEPANEKKRRRMKHRCCKCGKEKLFTFEYQ